MKTTLLALLALAFQVNAFAPQLAPRATAAFLQRSTLFMGWGPEPEWSSAKVTKVDYACQSGKSVTLKVDVSPETLQGFETPGQYVQVRLNADTKPLFLAIANAPGSGDFEFLVKKTDGNEWLTEIDPGVALEVSQIMGGGFPLQENMEGFKYDFPTQNVLLFAAGSGIAPIMSAIDSGKLDLGTRTCKLYYGERTAKDLCCVDKFAEWEAAGVQVVPVISQPDDTWNGRAGYVQTALEEDGVQIPRNSAALLCGMKGMTENVKELLTKAGVFEGRIMFNF